MHAREFEVGLHACHLPESSGGLGAVTLIEQALGHAGLALAQAMCRHCKLLAACDREQILHFLQQLMPGENATAWRSADPTRTVN